MDVRRLRPGEWLAGLGGAALLGVMFLDWYGVEGGYRSVSAWEAFSIADVIFAIAALLGIALAVMTVVHRAAAVPVALASLLGSVATFALLVLAWKTVAPPDVDLTGLQVPIGAEFDTTRETGVWLGLVACAAIVAGAIASMKDESFPESARAHVPVETLQPPEGGRA